MSQTASSSWHNALRITRLGRCPNYPCMAETRYAHLPVHPVHPAHVENQGPTPPRQGLHSPATRKEDTSLTSGPQWSPVRSIFPATEGLTSHRKNLPDTSLHQTLGTDVSLLYGFGQVLWVLSPLWPR